MNNLLFLQIFLIVYANITTSHSSPNLSATTLNSYLRLIHELRSFKSLIEYETDAAEYLARSEYRYALFLIHVDEFDFNAFIPPSDVLIMWFAHMMNPIAFEFDMRRTAVDLNSMPLMSNLLEEEYLPTSMAIWDSIFTNEPYLMDLSRPVSVEYIKGSLITFDDPKAFYNWRLARDDLLYKIALKSGYVLAASWTRVGMENLKDDLILNRQLKGLPVKPDETENRQWAPKRSKLRQFRDLREWEGVPDEVRNSYEFSGGYPWSIDIIAQAQRLFDFLDRAVEFTRYKGNSKLLNYAIVNYENALKQLESQSSLKLGIDAEIVWRMHQTQTKEYIDFCIKQYNSVLVDKVTLGGEELRDYQRKKTVWDRLRQMKSGKKFTSLQPKIVEKASNVPINFYKDLFVKFKESEPLISLS